MPGNYSQARAVFAIAKASLVAMLRSPTSVVFSLLFPVVFIIVFGAMVDNAATKVKVSIAPGCDTSNLIYRTIASLKIIQLQPAMSADQMHDALQKGQITAILDIKTELIGGIFPHSNVLLTTSNSSADKIFLLQSVINESISTMNQKIFPKNPSIANVTVTKIPGRAYKQIDFILPGQLGFSLLMAGVFATSFLLFSLRQSLVLKRFSVTPITRTYLIFGELLSRLFFQIIGFIIMVGLGYWAFDFTLVNGFLTFLEMLLYSVIGLIIFMGIGFIISGMIQDESSIAPIANTITLPQILLCGLFFPVENYPHWLQSFCKILPLTFFVDGLRKIAFEGTHIWQMPHEVIGMSCWAIIVSFITVKVFRWE
ncbi:MAG TPA: ABC transporter permease [Puia sp.]|jgi:ABC-2 type transport system permease protein|nr:ABC transporter permease [Puia sp.]